jgi:Ulp1 family protease
MMKRLAQVKNNLKCELNDDCQSYFSETKEPKYHLSLSEKDQPTSQIISSSMEIESFANEKYLTADNNETSGNETKRQQTSKKRKESSSSLAADEEHIKLFTTETVDLADEADNFEADADNLEPADKLFTAYNIVIKDRDVKRLDDGGKLNCSLVELFCKHFISQLPVEKKKKVHFCSTTLVTKLLATNKTPLELYNSEVVNYTRIRGEGKTIDGAVYQIDGGVFHNIFEKDIIIFPVHHAFHWSLCVVVHPGKINDPDSKSCMILMDSLEGCHDPIEVKKCVTNYLSNEFKKRNFLPNDENNNNNMYGTIKLIICDQVRKQTNCIDCGVFLIKFCQEILKLELSDNEQIEVNINTPNFTQEDVPFERTKLKNIKNYLQTTYGDKDIVSLIN